MVAMAEDLAAAPAVPSSAAADLRERAARVRSWLLVPGWRAHVMHAVGVFLVGVVGAAIGAALAPSTSTQVGPIQAEVSVVPSLSPGVTLLLPPAGQVSFATHVAPFAIQARISEVDLEGARGLIDSPSELDALRTSAPDQLRTAALQAAGTTALCALAGALLLSLLVYRRRWRRTAEVASAVAVVVVVVGGVGGVTFDPDKFAQPRFTGLLGQAPYVAGQASSLMRRLESYRSGLADIVGGITTLYATSDRLPVVAGADDVVSVLHVSDIHLNPLGFDLTQRLVKEFDVDMVVDTGDITTWGTEVESSVLSRIKDVGVPYVFVRGNHDSLRTQQAVAQNPNAIVLDGDVKVVKGLVLAGIGDPRFTPDANAPIDPLPSPSVPTKPAPTPSSTPGTARTPGTSSGAPTATPSPSASPRPDWAASSDPEVRAGGRLADIVQAWNTGHPRQPVAVAAVHEPYAVPPLLGHVPVVLAGHFHSRSVKLDPSGTRIMIEGSTGGAGITSDTMHQVADGTPVPLDATLLYIARAGDRAGQVVAYDQITVGGFGLASVTIERTVIRPGTEAVLAPGEQGPPTKKATPTPKATAKPTVKPTPTPSPSTPPAATATSSASGRRRHPRSVTRRARSG
jgi:Calcineurin-like phosphoesterase